MNYTVSEGPKMMSTIIATLTMGMQRCIKKSVNYGKVNRII